MIKRSSALLLAVLVAGCMQQNIRETRDLDHAFLDVQKQALWHREYSFLVIKFRGKNDDSVRYYERKMDSTLGEYQYFLRKYTEMVAEHKKKK